MNISDLIDQYEQGAKLRGLAPTQLNALKPVRRGLGRRTPGNLRPKDVQRYVGQRMMGEWTNSHSKCAADGTIRRELGALSAVLNWSHQKRILKDAPPTIDLPPPSPPREVFLTKDEADDLWCYAERAALDPAHEHHKAGLFTCLALDTWARAASIETLPWSRVDLPNMSVDYRDPARHETAKRRVRVPMSTRLHSVLTCASMRTEPRGNAVVGPVTQYAWRKFLDHVKLGKDITRHDLRRTGISLAVARGVDLMKIAQMAGDNYNTIIRHYARFAPDYLDGVVY